MTDSFKIIKKYTDKAWCENCGEFAIERHLLSLPNARTNPASTGYGKDDISRCSDAEAYSCGSDECNKSLKNKEGYEWGGTYGPFKDGFKIWREKEITQEYKDLVHFQDSSVGLYCIDQSPTEDSIDWIRENSFQLTESK